MFTVGKVFILGSIFLLANIILGPVVILAESQSGSVGLSGTVLASAPKNAPVISLPLDQIHFTESEITVSGICQSDQLIKIFINDIFKGAVVCSKSKFTVAVDLSPGKNQIIAKGFDNLDQAGPDSNIVEVYLDTSEKSEELSLTSNYARQNIDPKKDLFWPVDINGGVKPYAVSVDWGDGRSSLKSVSESGEFLIDHNYQNPGIYKLVIRAVDTKDDRAVLQLVVVVNGKVVVSSNRGDDKKNQIFVWQPTSIMIVFMIFTFWLGKKYEQRLLQS